MYILARVMYAKRRLKFDAMNSLEFIVPILGDDQYRKRYTVMSPQIFVCRQNISASRFVSWKIRDLLGVSIPVSLSRQGVLLFCFVFFFFKKKKEKKGHHMEVLLLVTLTCHV